MVQEGRFSLRAWLRWQAARFANWLCGPVELYWADKEGWDEFLQPMELVDVLLAVSVTEKERAWLEAEAYILGKTLEETATALLGERIEQINVGRLGVGGSVEVVRRWRSISKALMALDHSAIEDLSAKGYRIPWSDVTVLDGLLLEEDDGTE